MGGEGRNPSKTWTFKAKEFVVSKSRLKGLIKSASDLNNGPSTALEIIPVFYLAEQEACFSGVVCQCLRQTLLLSKDLRKFLFILLAGRFMYTYMKNSFVLGVHCCLPQKKGEHGHGTWTY